MNRKQRVEMIVKTLLMPFTCGPFTGEDLLLEKVLAYQAQAECTEDQHNILHEKYHSKRMTLLQTLQASVRTDRISELVELVEMFYPEKKLADRLDPHIGLDAWYVERLLTLATEFITLRDGVVSIRMWAEEDPLDPEKRELFPPHSGLYKVELWSEISRVITPDVLIAAYFVQCGISDWRYLKNVPDNISLSDSILSRLNGKGIAETHMHLRAGMSYLSVWEAVTDLTALRSFKSSDFQSQQKEEFNEHHQLVIAGWLRLMMARYLLSQEAEQPVDIVDYYDAKSPMPPFPKDTGEAPAFEGFLLRTILSGAREPEEKIMQEFQERKDFYCAYLRDAYQINSKNSSLDILARGPFEQYGSLHTAPELLLLYFSLLHIQKYPSHQDFIRVFLCYLRIKNSYFRDRVQSTSISGLTFFRRYFRKSAASLHVRKQQADLPIMQTIYRAAFQNQFHCANLKKLEIKISPPRIPDEPSGGGGPMAEAQMRQRIAKQLLNIIDAFLAVMEERSGDERNNIPTFGIVYHLLRSDTHHPSRKMCWAWPADQRPSDYVSRVRKKSVLFLTALLALLRDIPGLPELVVGLDAASEELNSEPWVYAPIYRFARSRTTTLPIQLSTGQPIQNLGLTYHVGEDYHHILSGLRHIDEVLTYFGYKAGDRIGHGLALQVDLTEWIHDNEVVSLPVMEYLEDLLWTWALCSEDGLALSQYLPAIEREIMEVARDLYQNIRGISPFVLWRTYRAKFRPLTPEFCGAMCGAYLKEPGLEPAIKPSRVPAQRSFCVLAGDKAAPPGCNMSYVDSVWDEDKLLMTHYCPIYTRHYQQPRFVRNSRKYLPLFQAIQAHIRTKVQNMGIYVETNPTSNLMIGDISGLHQYPIAKLNDPSTTSSNPASILLSINSDDPLVFNTNAENELALVYHALNHQDLSREAVLQWMDKVRQYGMDSSFIRVVKDPEEQRAFLEKVRGHLKSYTDGTWKGEA